MAGFAEPRPLPLVGRRGCALTRVTTGSLRLGNGTTSVIGATDAPSPRAMGVARAAGAGALRLEAGATAPSARAGVSLAVVVRSALELEGVRAWADLVVVPAPAMQDFALLEAVGSAPLPAILERGPLASLEEWLCAAERIVARGNPHLALCECGFRSCDPWSPVALDLASLPVLRRLTHLPVIVDPRAAADTPGAQAALARAASALGVDGLIVDLARAAEVSRFLADPALVGRAGA